MGGGQNEGKGVKSYKLPGILSVVQRVKDLGLSSLWHRFNPWPGTLGKGSGLVVALCGIGHSCCLDLIPGLGTSICCECGQRRKKKKKMEFLS